MAPIGVALDAPSMLVWIEDGRAVTLAIRIRAFSYGHVTRSGDERGVLAIGDFVRVDGESANVAPTADALFRPERDLAAIDATCGDDALIVEMRSIHALHRRVYLRRRRGAAAREDEHKENRKEGLVGAAGFELATLSSQS